MLKNLTKLIILINLSILTFFQLSNEIKAQPSLQSVQLSKNDNFYQMRDKIEEIWKDIPDTLRKGGWKQFKRWEHFWETRLNPDGTIPNVAKYLNSYFDFINNSKRNSLLSKVEWKALGPFTNPPPPSGGDDKGVGRVNIMRFHPTKPRTIWAGAASGGLWYSNDFGRTWAEFPFTQFLSLGISDIQFCQDNPRIAYVATGDANGIGGGGGNSYSIGVLKTTDEGASWTVTNLAFSLNSQQVVAKLFVHPNYPNIVVAATSSGIYKTTDGGITWINKNNQGYFKDLVAKPGNPNVLYAATYGSNPSIYKSTDMGETWNSVHQVNGANRIALAVTPANNKNIYALCSTTPFHSFRVSYDEGATWTVASSNSGNTPNILGRDDGTGNDRNVGQGWYDLCVAVAPWDDKEIFVGGINIWKSKDGGFNWEHITHWYGGYNKPLVHADIHYLIYDEVSGDLFATNDGGIDRTSDGGKRWITVDEGMNITQFYRLGVSYTNPNMIIAGSQDNGTSMLVNGSWKKMYGGDGMECAIDPTNANNIYLSIYNGNLYRTSNGSTFSTMLSRSTTGENGAWVTPFLISPHNPDKLIAGYSNVWASWNNGRQWKKISNFSGSTLRSLAFAPSDSNTIYAATLNTIYVTYDGGTTWKNITNPQTSLITYIAVDQKNHKRIWITNGGYSAGSKVFEYDGTTWKNISGNLPNVPVNTIVYQNNSPDRLYIGTDIGVFYSDYGSAFWEPYGQGMPYLIISELEIHYPTKKIRAATYGQGIWEAPIIECNVPQPKVRIIGETKICKGDSVIIEAEDNYPTYQWSNGETTKRIIIKESGTYSLTIDDGSGCKSRSQSIEVTVLPLPDLTIRTVGKHPVCEGDSINLELSGSLGFTSYEWSTGEKTRRIQIKSLGEYTLTATTSEGCKAIAKFNVVTAPKPQKPTITRLSPVILQSSEAKSYQWYFNGKPIKDSTSRTITITELGDYSVEIFDENNCSNLSEPYNIISNVNDLIDNNIIQITPNPSSGRFFIHLSKPIEDEFVIEITNILGKQVFYSKYFSINQSSFTVDLTNIPSGVYYIVIRSKGIEFNDKLIKF
ncbi:MAG: T9SS type A sorting domain-containing protein [Candidatus Kapabacteria bacterium]|nr:T9SS type A sorting domain-containing protein [Candidatus Kapabacteria bacterium]